jgi:hypothetical protein
MRDFFDGSTLKLEDPLHGIGTPKKLRSQSHGCPGGSLVAVANAMTEIQYNSNETLGPLTRRH